MAHGVSTTRLARRMDRITAARYERTMWAAAATIAVRYGVTPQEVLDEARRLQEEARHLGITAVEVVANEWGMTVAEVWADVTANGVGIVVQGVRCAR